MSFPKDFTIIEDTLEILEDHAHKAQQVYPTMAAPVTLTKAAGAWAAFPTPVEVVPASTITDEFDIHFVSLSGVSANGNYELILYKGAALSEIEICRVPFVRTTNKDHAALQVQTPIVDANGRISAGITSSNAGADTADVKLEYHTY